MATPKPTAPSPLVLEGLLGFNGAVPSGLQYTPDGRHVVYPLGAMCVVQDLATEGRTFLMGHRHAVSAVAISPDGRLLATGEETGTPGTKADILVWDLAAATERASTAGAGGSTTITTISSLLRLRLRQHLGKVQDLGFACDSQLLASLGGRDDNTVLVWRLTDHLVPHAVGAARPAAVTVTAATATAMAAAGDGSDDDVPPSPTRALCGARASDDQTLCLRWLHARPDRFVTGGYFSLRVWEVDPAVPRVHAMEARTGSLRRTYQCLAVSRDDRHCYAGTRTGDLVRVRIDRDPIPRSNSAPDIVRPTLDAVSKDKFGQGVRAVAALHNLATGGTNLLVGAGDGQVALVNGASLRPIAGKSAALLGAVTSLAIVPHAGDTNSSSSSSSSSSMPAGFLVGTEQSNRYHVALADFARPQLRGTCHYAPINAVAFPAASSDLFVTCSCDDVRVWDAARRTELLRIIVPNLEARAVAITGRGGTLLSGWSDGKIRAFYPETGKLRFVIGDAHTEAVTALAVCHDDEARPPWRLLSGGADGRVRVWKVWPSHQALAFSAKDHRGAVHALTVTRDNQQCISASADGSCIVWDLATETRLFAILEPTAYEAALYHPDGSQILTCGLHHQISYWDAADGSPIRVLEGGGDAVTALDIAQASDGARFASGGADRLVRVWDYDDGRVVAVGRAHSGAVRDVKFSPDERRLVSVGAEGGIFIWRLPPPPAAGVAATGAGAVVAGRGVAK